MEPWMLKARHSYSPSSPWATLSKWSQRPCASTRPPVSPRLPSFFFHSTFGVGLTRGTSSQP